jgi:hypothetical protein
MSFIPIEPTVVRVGERFPGGPLSFPTPGLKALLHPGHGVAMPVACLDGLTDAEVAGWNEGQVEFALVRFSRHTAFLLLSVRSCCGWSALPLQLAENGPGHRAWTAARPPDPPGFGRMVTMFLLDHPSQRVLAIRALSASPDFCARLDQLMAEQERNLPAYNQGIGAYDDDEAYRVWRDAEAMLPFACVREVGGQPFSRGDRR